MEVENASSGQLPVGAPTGVEEIIGYFLTLPFEDQKALLLMAASEIVPRLRDLTRDEFIDQLRHVPPSDGRLPSGADEQAESRNEVFEDWLRQPIGAQQQILELVAPRVVVNLHGPDRDEFLIQMSQVISDLGEGKPTIH